MSKEKVFILNLLGFECYWTGVIDEHYGALTAVSYYIGFHNLGRQKELVYTCTRLDNNQEEDVPHGSYFDFFVFLSLRCDLYFA